jgi:hypothetical protein
MHLGLRLSVAIALSAAGTWELTATATTAYDETLFAQFKKAITEAHSHARWLLVAVPRQVYRTCPKRQYHYLFHNTELVTVQRLPKINGVSVLILVGGLQWPSAI